MSGYNGSGQFSRIYNWQNDKLNGIKIVASRMDGEDNNFASGLSNVICKDGQQTTTARIPFAQGVSVNPGAVGAPGINFTSDTGTGLYQSASGALDVTSEGVRVGGFTSAGLDNTVIGAGNPLAGSFTTLAATGNQTVGGTLTVTGNTTLNGTLTVNGGSLIARTNAVIFTNSGTYIPSTGLLYALVEMVAGGGGGGATGGFTFGVSGSAGAYLMFVCTAAQIGASQTITVGAAGSAVAGLSGGNGGNTSFGTLATCTGGAGGSGGNASGSTGFSGAGGTYTLTTGTLLIGVNGQQGGMACNNNQALTNIGAGGSTPLGLGAPELNQFGNGSIGGRSGVGYGFGGGGASVIGSGTANGTVGGAGIVKITEYLSK